MVKHNHVLRSEFEPNDRAILFAEFVKSDKLFQPWVRRQTKCETVVYLRKDLAGGIWCKFPTKSTINIHSFQHAFSHHKECPLPRTGSPGGPGGKPLGLLLAMLSRIRKIRTSTQHSIAASANVFAADAHSIFHWMSCIFTAFVVTECSERYCSHHIVHSTSVSRLSLWGKGKAWGKQIVYGAHVMRETIWPPSLELSASTYALAKYGVTEYPDLAVLWH